MSTTYTKIANSTITHFTNYYHLQIADTFESPAVLSLAYVWVTTIVFCLLVKHVEISVTGNYQVASRSLHVAGLMKQAPRPISPTLLMLLWLNG